MRLSGQMYEVEGMDEYEGDVQDAVVTNERIAMDWEEDGEALHAVLHSTDGGYSYKGTFGEPVLDPNCLMEAWRFKSLAGDELLWATWYRKDTGFGGTSFFHLGSDEDS